MSHSISYITISLIICAIFLLFSILKTRLHPFLVLIATATLAALLFEVNNIPDVISTGFGTTLGKIGLIIGFGVILGELFERSGASKRMALCFIKLFGKGREDLAMLMTGYIISIPLFCDAAFIVLLSFLKKLSIITQKSFLSLGLSLGAGFYLTHCLVPPTPGPIGVAFMFKIDLGQFMLLSVLLAIPIAGVALIFIRYYSKKFSNFSSTNFIEENIDEQKLPSIFNSFMPICLPILLIISNAIIPFLNINTQINQIMNFLGNPVIAIGIGLLWALATLCLDKNKDEVILLSDKSLSSAASIIFVTGAGGALGHVLSISEAGKTLATTLTQTSLPLIILPFLISAILKILQGSSTVAMLTSAAICSPILLDTNLNPILAAMSCTVGGMFASHFNDSYFWVLCKNLNINNSKHQLKYWTNLSILMSLSGLLILIIINMFV